MKLKEEIFSEQLSLLLKLLLLPLVATLLNASVIVYVLRSSEQYEGLITWLWVNAIIILLRFLVYLKFKSKLKRGVAPDKLFYRLFFAGIIASALAWAYLVVFLFPKNDLVYQIFIGFMWAGMTAGALSSLSVRFEMYATYATIMLLPLSFRFFLIEEDVSFFMGLTSFAFWIVMLSSSWKLYNTTKEGFELSYENSDLLKEVDSLNKQLKNKLDLAEAEVRHQEAILFQQSKLASMGEMIGNIAHQWRQPLNALAITIQDVEDAYEFGELDKNYIDQMSEKSMAQINYMSKTIDDFRDFVKPNQKLERFDLYEAVSEALSLVSQSLEKYGVNYAIKEPSTALKAFWYSNEFKQVIVNLLNNAKDAIVENKIEDGQIEITFSQDQENSKVFVQDNAGGIANEVIDRIFEPYFTTKEEGKGTGIGLYMSHIIITEKMHGELEVKNVEGGALFTITLPLINDEATKGENDV